MEITTRSANLALIAPPLLQHECVQASIAEVA